MEFGYFPIERFTIARTNMRYGRKAPDIRDILPSVRTRGVIVPVIARGCAEAGPLEIEAGRRRYFGGYLIAVYKLDFNAVGYLKTTRQYLEADDFMMALVKAAVFGFFIALMGCYHGLKTQGGAAGVGIATTRAVVSTFILILLSNLLITVIAFG